nr:hypothetical protein Iba_chr12dCG11540 [Ipomoea batatas]
MAAHRASAKIEQHGYARHTIHRCMVGYTAMAAHYTQVEFGTKTELPENYRNILKFLLGHLVCNDVVFGRALGVAILIGVANAVAVILARSLLLADARWWWRLLFAVTWLGVCC